MLSTLPSVLHRWLGFFVDFGNGLGGVVVGNRLGFVDLGLVVCRSRAGLADLNLDLLFVAWWSGGCCWVLVLAVWWSGSCHWMGETKKKREMRRERKKKS